jgi:hypothetical protein
MYAHLALAATLLFTLAAAADDKTKEDKIDFAEYQGHFEKNTSGLKGDASFLAFTDREGFDKVFGTVPPLMGKKPNVLPKDAFEKNLVAAVIHRGNAPWEYKVDKVTAQEGTLRVYYTAMSKAATTAKFSSPLILTVPKGKYTSVVFIENNKEAGTAKLDK